MNFKEACLETVIDFRNLTVDLFLNGKILSYGKSAFKLILTLLIVASSTLSGLTFAVGVVLPLMELEDHFNTDTSTILFWSAITCIISSFFTSVIRKMGWLK